MINLNELIICKWIKYINELNFYVRIWTRFGFELGSDLNSVRIWTRFGFELGSIKQN